MPPIARTEYTGLQIALHWVIALLVLVQLLFGESMAEVIEAAEEGEAPSPLDQSLGDLHYWAGLAILALVVVRIALRVRLGRPAPIGGKSLANTAAEALHGLFYVLLVVVPVTGLLGFYVGDPWGELHELSKPVFIVLIVIHAAAALYHHFVVKDTTLRRMLRTDAV